jgi:hypothetical protein
MPILTPIKMARRIQGDMKNRNLSAKKYLNTIQESMELAKANGTHDLYKRLKLIETQVLKELED